MKSLSDEAKKKPLENGWSALQIIEHLVLSNKPYLSAVSNAIQSGNSGDSPISHTWIGRFLLRVAGPTGNAPAPKPFQPSSSPTDSILDTWVEIQQSMTNLAKTVDEIDLVKTRIQNPVIKLFKMNLADVFEIWIQHTERHLQQIQRTTQ